MERSFLDYAMSVITARALPDARDGLKPVQRRILYGMYAEGMRPDRPHRKCANAVGEVMGKYHPHGDQSIYDALARMAQDFSLRYPLIDGHGNFGSPNDRPAAARYTEARLSPLAMELLGEIDEDTVDFGDTYDGRNREPLVVPARFPNLLVNGGGGIAVGMATNIPPHNLSEVIDATLHLIDNPDATVEDLMRFVTGPDFPTGAIDPRPGRHRRVLPHGSWARSACARPRRSKRTPRAASGSSSPSCRTRRRSSRSARRSTSSSTTAASKASATSPTSPRVTRSVWSST